METIIRTNAFQLAQRMRDRAATVKRNLEAVAQDYASRMGTSARGVLLERIYAVPIPVRRRSGKPQWDRRGTLLGAESAAAAGTAIVLRNTAPHAAARRDLGTPGGRRIRSPGVQSVQWHETIKAQYRGPLLEARRAAARRGIEEG